jgi:hypothetical protein
MRAPQASGKPTPSEPVIAAFDTPRVDGLRRRCTRPDSDQADPYTLRKLHSFENGIWLMSTARSFSTTSRSLGLMPTPVFSS